MSYSEIEAVAHTARLIVMGAQHPCRSEAKGLDSGTLILLGTGPEFWDVFQAAPEGKDGHPDPVDRWSARVIGDMADSLGAEARFPFGGPPYEPFIDWALKSGRAFQSPVGALVHDTVGMMISYRGALWFDRELAIPTTYAPSPCITCSAPCSTSCPVGALNSDTFYQVDACHSYLDTKGGQTCMTQGCTARLACPLSAGAERNPAQTAHHMQHFHPR